MQSQAFWPLFSQAVGIGLILLASVDVFLTVFYPRTGKSVISLQLSKVTWELFRQISRWLPTNSKNILSYCGPILVVLIAVIWVCTFALGFALLFWPALGQGIQASQGKTPTDFATAFYYSGFTLTTLGVGDLVAKTGFWRLVTVLEAAVGFSIITASLSYLLSVYSSLTRRNTFALSLYHRSAGEVDAASLLVRLKGYGQFEPATQEISDIARELLFLLETHHAYPVLHYFHFGDPRYALARMSLISLDLATLIKSALHQEAYKALIESAAVAELESGGLDMLTQLSESFLGKVPASQLSEKQAWRRRYFKAIEMFEENDLKTVVDVEAGADEYVVRREQWNAIVLSFSEYMEHKWHDIAPAEREI